MAKVYGDKIIITEFTISFDLQKFYVTETLDKNLNE